MRSIEVYVRVGGLGKSRPKVDRTVSLGNGVHIDVNDKVGIVGVEIIGAEEVTKDGKKV